LHHESPPSSEKLRGALIHPHLVKNGSAAEFANQKTFVEPPADMPERISGAPKPAILLRAICGTMTEHQVDQS
jgi:hypothetical protein